MAAGCDRGARVLVAAVPRKPGDAVRTRGDDEGAERRFAGDCLARGWGALWGMAGRVPDCQRRRRASRRAKMRAKMAAIRASRDLDVILRPAPGGAVQHRLAISAASVGVGCNDIGWDVN